MSVDGQGRPTYCRRNIAENFNRLSRAHERYRRQTDDRWTGIAYSEREREFTFAKIENPMKCKWRKKGIGLRIARIILHISWSQNNVGSRLMLPKNERQTNSVNWKVFATLSQTDEQMHIQIKMQTQVKNWWYFMRSYRKTGCSVLYKSLYILVIYKLVICNRNRLSVG